MRLPNEPNDRVTTDRGPGDRELRAQARQAAFAPQLLGVLLLGWLAGCQNPLPSGILVRSVEPGFAAQRAGLQPGDLLLEWRAAGDDGEKRGDLLDPLDLLVLEIERANARLQDSATELRLLRDGESLRVELGGTAWGLDSSPVLVRRQARRLAALDEAESNGDLHGALEQLERLEGSTSQTAGFDLWLSCEGMRLTALAEDWEAAGKYRLTAIERATDVREQVAVDLLWGRFLQHGGRLAEAEAILLTTAETASDVSSAIKAELLDEVGLARWRQGKVPEAERAFDEAWELRKARSERSLAAASSLNRLGLIKGSAGDLAAARELFERALELRRQLLDDSLETAATLENLGFTSTQQGRFGEADEKQRTALAIKERWAPGSEHLARAHTNNGLLDWYRGNLRAAQRQYLDALELWRRLQPESIEVGLNLQNLGTLGMDRYDLDSARRYFGEALEHWQRVSPSSPWHVTTLASLGDVELYSGNLEQADEHLRAAQEMMAGSVNPETAFVFSSLARLAHRRGDLDEALALHRQALDVHRQTRVGQVEMATSLMELGEVEGARGNLQESRRLLLDALEVFEELVPGSSEEVWTLSGLATGARLAGNLDDAASYYARALTALDVQERRLGGPQRVRAQFASNQAQIYHRYVSLLLDLGRDDDAFVVQERYRARVLREMIGRRDLSLSVDLPPSLASEVQRLDFERDQLLRRIAGLSADAPTDTVAELKSRRSELSYRRQQLLDDLREVAPRLEELGYDPSASKRMGDLQLDEGTLAVAFMVAEDVTLVFAVSGNGEARRLETHRLALTAAELENRVSSLRLLLESPAGGESAWTALEQRAANLYDLLLGTIDPRLEAAHRLLVVPDGALHHLPFSALLRESDGEQKFLASELPVHVVAALSLRGQRPTSPTKPPTEPRLVAFADPLLDESVGASSLEPLPAAREEVSELERLFPRAQLFVGDDAREDRALSLAPEADFLHFATHAAVDAFDALDSYLQLAPGRSELHNGRLEAAEIFARLRLDAELVVLSGCETGGGEATRGEGLLGLTRAFQYAGARSVIATLWPVSDRYSKRLVLELYRRLADGSPKDEALRAAQASLIDEGAHPFHWAAFQLHGDWQYRAPSDRRTATARSARPAG